MIKSRKFDYSGVAALGDYKPDDFYDKWEEIEVALKSRGNTPIPIKRSHGDVREQVGSIKYWDLDKRNKLLYVGWNQEDLDEGIKLHSNKDGDFNVSIEYEIQDNKIIGINHIAVGNFDQKCPLKVCNITKRDRGDEPSAGPDIVDGQNTDNNEEPEDPQESEENNKEDNSEENNEEQEITSKILLEEINLLKKQLEELSKAKDKPEPKPEEEGDEEEKEKQKIKLGFQDKMKHDLPTDKETSKVFTEWKFVKQHKTG
ncbi:MAG: hypothetical protein ACFFCE_05725 [Promethearchaeota archaeon]